MKARFPNLHCRRDKVISKVRTRTKTTYNNHEENLMLSSMCIVQISYPTTKIILTSCALIVCCSIIFSIPNQASQSFMIPL
jgi:hypothetical protein